MIIKNPLLRPYLFRDKWLFAQMDELGFTWSGAANCLEAYDNLAKRGQIHDVWVHAIINSGALRGYLNSPLTHLTDYTLVNSPAHFIECVRKMMYYQSYEYHLSPIADDSDD